MKSKCRAAHEVVIGGYTTTDGAFRLEYADRPASTASVASSRWVALGVLASLAARKSTGCCRS